MIGIQSGGVGCPEHAARLAAFLDGELPPEEEVLLRRHVAGCGRCTDDLAEQESARVALRSAFRAIQTPPNLRRRIERPQDGTRAVGVGKRGALLIGAMAAAITLIAALAVLRATIRVPSNAQITTAAAAHAQETLAATPVSFSSSDAVAVSDWIRRQSGRRVEAVSFASAGYHLLGARMEPSLGPRAVSLVYEGTGGRITCVILPTRLPAPLATLLTAADPAIRSTDVANSTVVSWADRDASYLLVGDGDAQTLLQLARLAAASS